MSPERLDMLRAGLLSLGPGLVWLYYLYRLDRRRPEPLGLVLGAFAAGALATAGVVSTVELATLAFPSATGPGPDATSALFYFVVWVGLVEEGWKLLSVRLTVYFSPTFDQPSDGLVYAGAAALGFATAENAVYILRSGEDAILLQRWLLSTFGHVLMATFWGFGLGLAKAGPGRVPRPGPARRPEAGTGVAPGAVPRRPAWSWRLPVLTGLALSALVHGLYDWALVRGWLWAGVLGLLALWGLFTHLMREAVRLSPHRAPRGRRLRECPRCNALVRWGSRFCTSCGDELPAANPARAWCPSCLRAVPAGGAACGHCGCMLAPGANETGSPPAPG